MRAEIVGDLPKAPHLLTVGTDYFLKSVFKESSQAKFHCILTFSRSIGDWRRRKLFPFRDGKTEVKGRERANHDALGVGWVQGMAEVAI